MRVGHSEYHGRTYNPARLKETVKRVAKKLRQLQRKLKFDAIAFRGSSGAAIAYPVSMLTGIHLIYVRKERKHHGTPLEGTQKEVKKYVILDDFVCYGETIKAIARAIRLEAQRYVNEDAPECVGICLYDRDDELRSYNIGTKRKQQLVQAYEV